MCTYNVRTLQTEDNLDRLIDEADQSKWDVVSLCETYRKGKLSEIKGGYWLYEIGKTEYNPHAKGLTFLIHPKINDCVTDFKIYSNRVIKMKVKLQAKDSVTVTNAYARTSKAENQKWNNFMILKEQTADSGSKYKIITGDFHAEIGNKNKRRRLHKHGSIWTKGEKWKRRSLSWIYRDTQTNDSKCAIPEAKKQQQITNTRLGSH